MLLLMDTSTVVQLGFKVLSPVIWYASIVFILLFLFQGSGYRFQKEINEILFTACVAVLIGIGVSERAYVLLYGIQLFISWVCFLMIIASHWNRISYVLKSEWKCIAISVAVIAAGVSIYYFTTIEIPYHMSNFGSYIPILLFGISIHGIVVSLFLPYLINGSPSIKEGKDVIMKESRYYTALQQLQKEEQLKTDFANFLHDDIL